MGLKNVHGLYGSPEWWENIYSGKIPGHKVSGVITEMVYAGMDSRWGDEVNTFRLKLDDGSTIFESIYTRAHSIYRHLMHFPQKGRWLGVRRVS